MKGPTSADNWPIGSCYERKQFLQNMYEAITSLELWDELSVTDYSANKKYPPCIAAIESHSVVRADGHSASTFNVCIGYMIIISQIGWDQFCTQMRNK